MFVLCVVSKENRKKFRTIKTKKQVRMKYRVRESARKKTRSAPRAIIGGHSGTRTGFSPYTSVFLLLPVSLHERSIITHFSTSNAMQLTSQQTIASSHNKVALPPSSLHMSIMLLLTIIGNRTFRQPGALQRFVVHATFRKIRSAGSEVVKQHSRNSSTCVGEEEKEKKVNPKLRRNGNDSQITVRCGAMCV